MKGESKEPRGVPSKPKKTPPSQPAPNKQKPEKELTGVCYKHA